MIDSTNRMYAAAKKLDPRIQQCREFAGTFDGRTVVRFRCDGGAIQSPFDSSHLEHWHISFWRSRVRWNHQGLYEVITGDGMLTPNQAQQLINVHDWIYDLCRGLITADPGTAHITKYVPNEILKTLQDRPPVQSAPVDVAALAAALAADTTFINANADAVLAGLPTHDERVQESFEGAQRAENE